ncbi:MAG TPA: ABC transporter substrate-binding protein [Chloroflexota bacterium]|jgi:NitT/TauT family transport system substrate-binding protein|nr:ABC transporter substrate-binding protein [Chloroflexota bacterium]
MGYRWCTPGWLLGGVGVALILSACGGPAAPPAGSAGAAPGAAAPGASPPAPTGGSTASVAAATPARVALKTAYTTATAAFAPLLLAADTGLFAEQGLDAEVLFIGPGQPLLGALTSGEVPIVMAGAPQAIEAGLAGGDYVLLGAVQPYLTNAIYVAPEIQRPEDLRGKSVGVSNYGAISHVALRVALEHWGFVEGRDVQVVRSGGTPETLAAMQSGAIAGGSFSPPQTFRAAELGFRELFDVAATRQEMGNAAIVSTRRFTREQPDIVERYLKAVAKAIQVFRHDREAAVAAIMRQSRMDDRAVAERTWEWFRDKFNADLSISEATVTNNLRMMAPEKPEALQARPEQFLDTSFIERLRASGYFAQLEREG